MNLSFILIYIMFSKQTRKNTMFCSRVRTAISIGNSRLIKVVSWHAIVSTLFYVGTNEHLGVVYYLLFALNSANTTM